VAELHGELASGTYTPHQTELRHWLGLDPSA
jgi:hypothetical protein